MKTTMTPSMMSLAVLALMASLAATGCGGGGSSDSSTPAPTTQEPGKLMLSGVVATQTVQANAAVVAKCAVGGGNVHTAADGSYSLSLDKALLPCVLEADLFDGSRLHSAAYGPSGATAATANITPVTELVVANLAGSSPSQFYTDFNATSVPLVTSARATASVAAVNVSLANLNVNASVIGNPITATLVPAGTSATVNTYGQVLVQLDATLGTNSTTLAQLTTTTATAGAAPHLPAELLSQPQASNCAALRSGYYRAVWLMPYQVSATGAASSIHKVYIDSQTLKSTDESGSLLTTLTANGTCRYKGKVDSIGNAEDIVVDQSGVIMVQGQNNGAMRLGIVFPEQVHSLAELAGTYNAMTVESGSGHTGSFRLGNTGVMESASCFSDNVLVQTCTTEAPPLPRLTSHPLGGFSMTSADPANPWTNRWFTYRTGSGDLMMLWVGDGGSFGFGTPQRARSMPRVGGTSRSWSGTLDMNSVANTTAFAETLTVTKSVDAAASSYVRTARNLTLATDNSHDETVRVNWPRMGYNYRAAGSAPAPDGTLASFPEWLSMSLRGTGMGLTYLTPTTTRTGLMSIGVGQ